MFEDSYDYDYNNLVDNSDDLLDDDYYSDEYDGVNNSEFDYYYHTMTEELIDE